MNIDDMDEEDKQTMEMAVIAMTITLMMTISESMNTGDKIREGSSKF
jgi:hypothetical protein